jgi:hypothetical protein
MKEFMLLLHNEIDHLSALSPEQFQQFLQKVMAYIGNLTKEGKLIGAQPLEKQGKMIYGTTGAFKDGPFNETKEVIVGYYHILAKDIDEAIEIAKGNPEFEYKNEGAKHRLRIPQNCLMIFDGGKINLAKKAV